MPKFCKLRGIIPWQESAVGEPLKGWNSIINRLQGFGVRLEKNIQQLKPIKIVEEVGSKLKGK